MQDICPPPRTSATQPTTVAKNSIQPDPTQRVGEPNPCPYLGSVVLWGEQNVRSRTGACYNGELALAAERSGMQCAMTNMTPLEQRSRRLNAR